jgi:hypothetical protein
VRNRIEEGACLCALLVLLGTTCGAPEGVPHVQSQPVWPPPGQTDDSVDLVADPSLGSFGSNVPTTFTSVVDVVREPTGGYEYTLRAVPPPAAGGASGAGQALMNCDARPDVDQVVLADGSALFAWTCLRAPMDERSLWVDTVAADGTPGTPLEVDPGKAYGAAIDIVNGAAMAATVSSSSAHVYKLKVQNGNLVSDGPEPEIDVPGVWRALRLLPLADGPGVDGFAVGGSVGADGGLGVVEVHGAVAATSPVVCASAGAGRTFLDVATLAGGYACAWADEDLSLDTPAFGADLEVRAVDARGVSASPVVRAGRLHDPRKGGVRLVDEQGQAQGAATNGLSLAFTDDKAGARTLSLGSFITLSPSAANDPTPGPHP